MIRIFFISSLTILLFLGCHRSAITETSKNIPEWLQKTIDNLSNNRRNIGTKIYRYEWNEEYIYDLVDPSSSCIYCQIFDRNGKKIKFDYDTYKKFVEERKNSVLIWEWMNKQ